jgi:hypothetical protein
MASMCIPEPAANVGCMARTQIAIDLELDETADCPVGTARLSNGTSRAFHGWLELAQVIDAFTAGNSPSDATSPGDGRDTRHHRRKEPGE